MSTTGNEPRTWFNIEIEALHSLSIEEVWPDGNAPANPTTADVIAEVERTGSISRLVSEWNLEPERVTVNGIVTSLR